MSGKSSTLKSIIAFILLFFMAAIIYTVISEMQGASFSSNLITVLGLLASVIVTALFYKPLRMLFKPRDFSSKLILSAAALICVALEFDGLSKITKAVMNEKSKMPKFWWAYILVLVIVVICAFVRTGKNKCYSIAQLDIMQGHEFEYACADILRANGFKNVEVTRGSGDFGVDVLAEKNGIKYAIQCKCYSHKLDNKPIQEVIGGLACYGCTKGAVMTNQYFTEPAKELARINGVELWDRDVIQKMAYITPAPKADKPQYQNIENDIDAMNEELDKIDSQLIEVEREQNRTAVHDSDYLDHLRSINVANKLDEYEEIATKYIVNAVTDITSFYALNEIAIEFENADILYQSNEVVLEFKLCGNTRTSQFKALIKQLPKSLSVQYAEYIFPTSTPQTVGIKIPLPEYLEQTTTLIFNSMKQNKKE